MWLNAHTYYSYSYGTLSIERLLELARQSGNDRVVLTDINSTSAWVNFMRLAPQYGVEPYLGVDFRNGAQKCFVAIAANNEGLYEINQYLTQFLHRRESFPERAPQWQHTWVVYPWESYHHFPLRDFEWIGVSVAQVNKLFSQSASFRKRCVILQSTTFEHATGFNAHRLLRAIDNNQLLSKLPASELGLPDDRVFDLTELHKRFEAYPELVEQTHRLLNQCKVSIDFDSTKNKKSYTGSLSADVELLRNQCREGLLYRYGSDVPAQVTERMESELQVITSMNFTPYFLINWDMVNYARRKGYYYIGRGSGANSLVAYLMRITDVDPIELNLYFERFINPYRSTPPDFDIDFSWTDRQDVTRYLFDTHSWSKVALLGAYITFQFKSVVREIGKVLGLPAHEIDALQQARHQPNDKLARAVLKYAQLIHGFPSHLSIHSSGIVIANEDIARYSATFLPPKGFPTTQFSMLEAEDIGLHKYDVLGQRGLAKIKDAVHLIKQNRGVEIDIHDIKRFTKDKRIEKMLSRGDAIGCFYVESPAMRMLLTKLKAHDYLRLVAASSIIRPGVAKSGMMREY
ncbi:MAG TPA: PHP domain-containing protein, partial [Luteibaculaceae bacterium]|nr:PHP domain-containing protein [Luteibaculaceae bacterium]